MTQITDVIHFFNTITRDYENLERDIRHILDRVEAYTPGQLSVECLKLKEKKVKLSGQDQQLTDIMELAGSDIFHNPMIDEYRITFAKTNTACNALYEKLMDRRESLIIKRPRTSIQLYA